MEGNSWEIFHPFLFSRNFYFAISNYICDELSRATISCSFIYYQLFYLKLLFFVLILLSVCRVWKNVLRKTKKKNFQNANWTRYNPNILPILYGKQFLFIWFYLVMSSNCTIQVLLSLLFYLRFPSTNDFYAIAVKNLN